MLKKLSFSSSVKNYHNQVDVACDVSSQLRDHKLPIKSSDCALTEVSIISSPIVKSYTVNGNRLIDTPIASSVVRSPEGGRGGGGGDKVNITGIRSKVFHVKEQVDVIKSPHQCDQSSRSVVLSSDTSSPSTSGHEDNRNLSTIETISSRVTPRMITSTETSTIKSTAGGGVQHPCDSVDSSAVVQAHGGSSYASSDLQPNRQASSKTSENCSTRITVPSSQSSHHQSHTVIHSGDNEMSKKQREERRKAIKREFNKNWQNTSESYDKSGCNMSFVFNPWGKLMNYWSMIVCASFIYNSWVILYRFAFDEINDTNAPMWLLLDGIADFIYLCDIIINFRIGYFDEGVLQTDPSKIRQHYINSTKFYIDCLCLLPLDFLYLSIGFNSIFRTFRLIKIYRFWSFLDRTERHTNYPNVFRTVSLLHYILIMFHWNACLYQLISKKLRPPDLDGTRSDWFGGSRIEGCSDVVCDYLHAFYWSTLALTLIGDLPRPRNKGEYIFLIIELIMGLFLMATVLGHVANIVTTLSSARSSFQAKLDSVKTYMRMRRVPEHLKVKVIKWFDYLWSIQKTADEEKSVGFLPAKLKAEIAIHVHLETLKRVEIFQNTEAGFLCALVLRLKPVLFSPQDYVCRKGEVGKEMYIVNRGKLQVVADDGKTVLATLKVGSYFGEVAILTSKNSKRTASVRSVGYSDLFCLNKNDLWDVLDDYPIIRVKFESLAAKRLLKYRKDHIRKISMGRSRSTPGLVESKSNEVDNAPQDAPSTVEGGHDDPPEVASHTRPDVSLTRASPVSQVAVRFSDYSADKVYDNRYLYDGSHQLTASNSCEIYKSSLSAASSAPHLASQEIPLPTVARVSPSTTPVPGEMSQELLIAEIKRLRDRLHSLEYENAAMTSKLNQQTWEVNNRLSEIECQIGVTCTSNVTATSGSHYRETMHQKASAPSTLDDKEYKRYLNHQLTTSTAAAAAAAAVLSDYSPGSPATVSSSDSITLDESEKNRESVI